MIGHTVQRLPDDRVRRTKGFTVFIAVLRLLLLLKRLDTKRFPLVFQAGAHRLRTSPFEEKCITNSQSLFTEATTHPYAKSLPSTVSALSQHVLRECKQMSFFLHICKLITRLSGDHNRQSKGTGSQSSIC